MIRKLILILLLCSALAACEGGSGGKDTLTDPTFIVWEYDEYISEYLVIYDFDSTVVYGEEFNINFLPPDVYEMSVSAMEESGTVKPPVPFNLRVIQTENNECEYEIIPEENYEEFFIEDELFKTGKCDGL